MTTPYKLCFLGRGQILEQAKKVCHELELPHTYIEIVNSTLDTMANIVDLKIEQGYDVFISGAAQAAEFARYSRAPMAEVQVREIDYLIAVRKALSIGKHPVLVIYRYAKQADIKMLSDFLNTEIGQIIYEDEVELYQAIQNSTYDVIVGASTACIYAEELGRKSILIYAGEESIRQAFLQAHAMAVELRKERENDVLMQSIVAQSPVGIIVSDENDNIILMNSAAHQYTGIQEPIPLQKTLGDLLPNLSTKHLLSGTAMSSDSFRIFNDIRVRTIQSKLHIGAEPFGVLTTLQIDNRLRKKSETSKSARSAAKWEDIVNNSEKMRLVVTKGRVYSNSELPLLLYGECGTGKLQFAECVHTGGSRAAEPLITINLAAISENDAGRHLLGCSDLLAPHIGLLEAANSGTVILENLPQANQAVQACLMDVISRNTISRTGGYQETPADIRFITVLNGHNEPPANVRPDLFCLLNTLSIKMSPLRDRDGDIGELFLKQLPKRFQRRNLLTSNSVAHEILQSYHWPNNLPELYAVASRFSRAIEEYTRYSSNVIQTLLVNSIGEEELLSSILHLYPELKDWRHASPERFKTAIDTLKRLLRYNNTQICEKLGISRTTLWRYTAVQN